MIERSSIKVITFAASRDKIKRIFMIAVYISLVFLRLRIVSYIAIDIGTGMKYSW